MATLKSQLGMLLVQQMVALAVSATLLGLAGRITTDQWQGFRRHAQLSLLHQTAVQGQALLQRELANVGFWAGLSASHLKIPVNIVVSADCDSSLDSGSFPHLGTPYHRLMAGHVGDEQTPSCLTNAVKGNGFIQIKRLAGRYFVNQQATANRVVVELQPSGASFLTAASQVTAGSWRWPYIHEVYYISQQTNAGQTYPALMRKRLIINQSQQLVMDTDALLDGVELFEVEFGYDQNSDGRADYFGAYSSADASTICVIRYWLLFRSLQKDPQYKDKPQFQLGSRRWQAPADGYRRMLIRSAVRVMNHPET